MKTILKFNVSDIYIYIYVYVLGSSPPIQLKKPIFSSHICGVAVLSGKDLRSIQADKMLNVFPIYTPTKINIASSPLKLGHSQRKFHLPSINFQVPAVSFRECTSHIQLCDNINVSPNDHRIKIWNSASWSISPRYLYRTIFIYRSVVRLQKCPALKTSM